MKSSYERKRILIIFILLSIVLVAGTVLIFALTVWDPVQLILVLVLELIFILAVYILISRSVSRAYGAIEDAAVIMDRLLSDEDAQLPDDLTEGEIGLLYSNLSKLVLKFRENKLSQQSENEFLQNLLSDISHQLKTPLASLKIFTDLLLDEKLQSPEEQRRVMTEAKKQLDRMEWLVLSLLQMARIEAGAVMFDMSEQPLRPILMQAAESVGYLTAGRRQRIDIECPEDALIVADGRWLTEAIINLLKNASDYSDLRPDENDPAVIRIYTESNSLFTRIYVEDHGRGISEEELPDIFKRFYRSGGNASTDSVGIGLSLTKAIIEGMGGNIKAESEESAWTRFMITF